MPRQLFTIGHSTHSTNDFISLLSDHHIEALADIRRFPGSRRYPHFNRENLAASLLEAGIEYHWLEALGGRRGKQGKGTSPNMGLRNESFRNYADYMFTPDFRTGIEQLLDIAERKRTAFMCSEGLFWRCHRRLVSDYLFTKGFAVEHILPSGDQRPHTLMPGAQFESGILTYPQENYEARYPLFEND